MNLKFDLYKFTRIEASGIPVLFKKIPWASGYAYVHVIVGTGARSDPAGKEGIAHFFEHLPFNGCEGYPTSEATEEVDRRLFGGTLNAHTSMEHTIFHGKVAVERISEAAKFLRSMVFRPNLEKKEIERERKVVTQELWRNYGNLRREGLERRLRKIPYGDHPFARIHSPLGWHDTIAAITRDEFIAFHHENYRVGNVALVIIGDVGEKEAIEAARILTRGAPKGALIERPERLRECPAPKTNEVIESSAKLFGLKGAARMKVTRIRVQRILPWQWDENRAPELGLRLMRELLMSRIRRELGVTYSPSWGLGDFIDHQHASLGVEILPSALKPTLAIMRQSLEEIATGHRKHAKLFDEVKNAYIEQLRFRDDEVENIGYSACCEFNLRGRVVPIGEDVRYTEETSYRDVSDLFAREFTEEKLFWTILTP